MLQIPEQNIYEFDNIGYEKIQAVLHDMLLTVRAFTKALKDIGCGIGGKDLIGGTNWKRLRACLDLKSQEPVKSLRVSKDPHN